MIVVTDTSPFNYLVQMGTVDILPKLYGSVTLPGGALRELQAVGAPAAVRLWARDLPEWIKVVEVDASSLEEWSRLGRGESEAIALSLQTRADVVLIDDGPARKAAIGRGLSVSGTLGVLKDAADEGLLNFRESVAAIRALGFRMTDMLVEELLAEIERGSRTT